MKNTAIRLYTYVVWSSDSRLWVMFIAQKVVWPCADKVDWFKQMWDSYLPLSRHVVTDQRQRKLCGAKVYLQEMLTCCFQPIVSLYPQRQFLSKLHILCPS